MELYENTIFIPKGNLNIPRRNMPQVDRGHYPALLTWIREQNIGVRRVKIAAIKLKPVQKEINIQAVERLVRNGDPKLQKPFIITKDLFILDGHHRWLALLNIDRDVIIDAFEIDAKVTEALNLLREFPGTLYKDASNVEYNKPDNNLQLEQNDMPMTDKERFLSELNNKLAEIEPENMGGVEFACVLRDILDEMVHPAAIENERSYGSFREFVNESKAEKYSDPNERIHISGYGMVRIGHLETEVEDRLQELDKFHKRKDWRNVRYVITSTALLPMLDALKEIQDATE